MGHLPTLLGSAAVTVSLVGFGVLALAAALLLVVGASRRRYRTLDVAPPRVLTSTPRTDEESPTMSPDLHEDASGVPSESMIHSNGSAATGSPAPAPTPTPAPAPTPAVVAASVPGGTRIRPEPARGKRAARGAQAGRPTEAPAEQPAASTSEPAAALPEPAATIAEPAAPVPDAPRARKGKGARATKATAAATPAAPAETAPAAPTEAPAAAPTEAPAAAPATTPAAPAEAATPAAPVEAATPAAPVEAATPAAPEKARPATRSRSRARSATSQVAAPEVAAPEVATPATPAVAAPAAPPAAPAVSPTPAAPASPAGGRFLVPRRGRAKALLGVLDVPGAVVRRRDDVAAVLTRFFADAVRAHDAVHVVQLTDESRADVGVELHAAGHIVGDARPYQDLATAATTDTTGTSAGAPGPGLHGLRRPRVDGVAVKALRGASSAVLVVDTRRSRAADVADAAAMLDGLGVAVRGVVVWRGRIPRA